MVNQIFLIYLNDVDFVEDDPKTIIHVRLLAWHNKFENCKALKKEISKELMTVAWHSTRWWDWCLPEDEKKRNRSNFYWQSWEMVKVSRWGKNAMSVCW